MEKIPPIFYNIALAFISFIIFSPGLLLSIPASNDKGDLSPYINFTSREVRVSASFVHAFVFCLVYFGLSSFIKGD